MSSYVKQFFKGNPILKAANHTFITLIPKSPTAADMGDFWAYIMREPHLQTSNQDPS